MPFYYRGTHSKKLRLISLLKKYDVTSIKAAFLNAQVLDDCEFPPNKLNTQQLST